VVPDAADLTWAKIRFGDRSWSKVLDVTGQIDLAPTRVVVINAVRDAVRDAELHPADALTGLLGLLASEPSEVVLGSVLRFATDQLCGPYLPPVSRSAELRQVHSVASALLAAAAPGSDRQLTLFRAAVRSSADVDQLRHWLDRKRLPTGLDLDTDLGWAVATRLATLTGDALVVEQQLAADSTAAGRAQAAQARAAAADSAAKQRAWRSLMEPSDLSAYELYATATGFFQPDQSDLCAPYAERYFDEIGATAAFRSGWALGQIAALAYPAPHSEQRFLALAEGRLASGDLAPELHRSLVDGTDRLRRAVVSRQRFSPVA
jgi:aminopeptidase N